MVGVLLVVMASVAIGSFLISAIGFYKMNVKAGEAGWKAFIPFYSIFVRFGYAWNTKPFWIYFVGMLLANLSATESTLMSLIALAGSIAALVCVIKLDINTAKAFGRGTGTGILLVLFPFIMSLVLGFGSAQYVGNTTKGSCSN